MYHLSFSSCLGQVLDLQRDVGVLRQDLEAANTKLASSMNSIKTFWSPELKKERSMRRDELQVIPSCPYYMCMGLLLSTMELNNYNYNSM